VHGSPNGEIALGHFGLLVSWCTCGANASPSLQIGTFSLFVEGHPCHLHARARTDHRRERGLIRAGRSTSQFQQKATSAGLESRRTASARIPFTVHGRLLGPKVRCDRRQQGRRPRRRHPLTRTTERRQLDHPAARTAFTNGVKFADSAAIASRPAQAGVAHLLWPSLIGSTVVSLPHKLDRPVESRRAAGLVRPVAVTVRPVPPLSLVVHEGSRGHRCYKDLPVSARGGRDPRSCGEGGAIGVLG
jgi:hypothetical protein